MLVFQAALQTIFGTIGTPATYRPLAGEARQIMVQHRHPDTISQPGAVPLRQQSNLFDVMAIDIGTPQKGDEIEVDAQHFKVTEFIRLDSDGRIWVITAVPFTPSEAP